jgi:GH25 family lysozyme M1 (1,4-beta-N-acetylmuramidase)
MKNRIIIISIVLILIIFIIVGSILGYRAYQQWRIKNAVIIVEFHENLNIEVFSEVKLSDLITKINGKLVKDKVINTKKIGPKKVQFKYINDDDIEISYTFEVNVVDSSAPLIFSSKNYSVTQGYSGNLGDELFCGDNYDNTPKGEIIGNYDYNVVGSYPVTFKCSDSSGNSSSNDFNLNVKAKSTSGGSGGGTGSSSNYINFSDVVSEHKTYKTSIGIDVSRWQGDIDFQKVKDAGVEFVFIRVGSQKGTEGEYYIDPKFERNIKGFNEVGIPVGIYFYSYANSKDKAKKEAKWIIEQIKPYKIDLPVVFDWENWSFYNEFNLSFYNLTEMAKAYLKEIEKAGYEGMLYSSKNYLENVWMEHKYPVWLAHYTSKTNYQGEYKVWQLCSNGRVNGIYGDVDINVMYN